MVRKAVILCLSLLSFSLSGFAVKLKDIASIEGNRINYLIGYGLVVGLKGTGDGKATQFTVKSLANMLQKMGIVVDYNRLTVKNVAAVMVTAKVPPYAKAGMRFDVEVSSIGDAKSIQGGTLLLTPLRGPDGKIYALAQGQVIVGGYEARGRGASQTKNVPTVGRIPNGAVLEVNLPFSGEVKELNIYLDNPDYTVAKLVQDRINETFGTQVAKALDSATVKLSVPSGYSVVDFLAKVENVELDVPRISKVVIDSRTGTIILGGDVSINPVSVATGSLIVKITEEPQVVQPPPLSGGTTQQAERTTLQVREESRRIVPVKGATVKELVDSLNEIGATPREIISVLQAIKAAGALKAKLEVL